MSDTKSSTGTSLVGVLQSIFIVNKLTEAGEIADWSWWWVLCPLWLSAIVVITVGIVLGISKALDKKGIW